MSKRPIIGITRPVEKIDITKLFFRWALWLAGGKPVFLTQENYKKIGHLDGLILSGGSDINPSRYGLDPNSYVVYDNARDAFELDILDRMIQENKPVLGICRGMQLINVYKGGTLFTDIKKVYDIKYTPQSFFSKAFYRKTVFLKKNSLLNNKTTIAKTRVNSIHNQSVDKIGAGLEKIAYDRYNIVQGVESSACKILAVQWHPEYLFYRTNQIKIFKEFIGRVVQNKNQ